MKNNLNLLRFGIAELREGNSDPIQSLNILQSASESVSELFEALQTNNKPKRFSPINLSELILQHLSILESQSTNQEVVISYQNQNPDIEILGDSNQLGGAFFNLVLNAIEACKEGDTITVESWQSINQAHVVVSDTGRGMAAATLENMWKPFFTTKNDEFKSHGLGTYIARTAIINHNGSISAESCLNEGTTIHISLPLSHYGNPLAA